MNWTVNDLQEFLNRKKIPTDAYSLDKDKDKDKVMDKDKERKEGLGGNQKGVKFEDIGNLKFMDTNASSSVTATGTTQDTGGRRRRSARSRENQAA